MSHIIVKPTFKSLLQEVNPLAPIYFMFIRKSRPVDSTVMHELHVTSRTKERDVLHYSCFVGHHIDGMDSSHIVQRREEFIELLKEELASNNFKTDCIVEGMITDNPILGEIPVRIQKPEAKA